jgi:hypothetical protein
LLDISFVRNCQYSSGEGDGGGNKRKGESFYFQKCSLVRP